VQECALLISFMYLMIGTKEQVPCGQFEVNGRVRVSLAASTLAATSDSQVLFSLVFVDIPVRQLQIAAAQRCDYGP
jgi:hypothetical protein